MHGRHNGPARQTQPRRLRDSVDSMSTARITLDCTYDQPLSEEQRQDLIDRWYSFLMRTDNKLIQVYPAELFDVEVDVELRDA